MSHEGMNLKHPRTPSTRTPSAASTSSASTSDQHALGHGLRSQFGQLLPKHALFQVHVNIEQLSNVPLMSGQFAVRWKFRNVQSRSGILSKMRGSHSWSSKKGKGRASDLGLAIEVTPAAGEEAPDGDEAEEGGSSAQEDGTEDEVYTSHLLANGSYGDLLTAHAHTPETAVPVTPTPAAITKTPSSTSTAMRSVARGVTPWKPLQSYNVKWDHQVNVVVQMDVHRETSDLLPNEMKLVVMQRVIPGDPNSPAQPRLGAVYLNLAEYADQGAVTRRYLLRESKTNATLKLMIELEHVGGAQHYRPPPLRKGEVFASVTGLLSNNDLMRTSVARQFDEYTHPSTDSEGADTQSRLSAAPFMRSDGSVNADQLAISHGLRSTEDLIETLFNPHPSSSIAPSPFTYYAPEIHRPHHARSDTTSDAASLANSDSMRSVSSDGVMLGAAVSIEKLSATDSLPDLAILPASPSDAHKTWWKKIKSRPGTPQRHGFQGPASSIIPQREAGVLHA